MIAEVALSIVLLVSSGLMMRTLFALQRVNIGFDPAKVLYAQLSLPEGRYETVRQRADAHYRPCPNRAPNISSTQ